MTRIFISYRRKDSAYVAGILAEKIQNHFGRDSVFMDVDDIPFGVDFREHIANEVGKCDILLALIGDLWVDVRGKDGRRRLDDPADFVRLEIDTALSRNIPVVPILIGTADMPQESELPQPLKPLAYRNAAEIRSGRDLMHHIERLIRGLESQFRTDAPEAPIQPAKVQRRDDQVMAAHSVAVLGDSNASTIADLMRSNSFEVATDSYGHSKTIILAVDALDGPMPVHREVVQDLTLKPGQELLGVLTRTDLMDDSELLELIELEIREMLDSNNLDGDNVKIFRHPRDASALISYIKRRG